MSDASRKSPIWIVIAVAALAVGGVLFLLSRNRASTADARPAGTTAAEADDSSSLRAPASAASAERESLPVPVVEATPWPSPASPPETNAPRVVVAVREANKSPIAGAQVEITARGPLGKWTCDEDGRCKLPVEPWTGGLDLRVTAGGFVTTCQSSGRSEEIVVVLRRAVTVRGRVVAADDRSPVPGARISVGVVSCGEPELFAHADAAGRFVLSGLPLDKDWPWWVSADGFATAQSELELSDPSQDVELELARGLPLELLVVDAKTGAPIEGARVYCDAGEATSDPSGRISTTALMSVAVEEAVLMARASGYCSLRAPVRASELDADAPLRLPLLLGARLEGLVLDPQGQPVPDIEVDVSFDHAAHRKSVDRSDPFRDVALPEGWRLEGSRGGRATSDLNGRFLLEGLEPSSKGYRMNVRRGGVEVLARQQVPELGAAGSSTPMQLVVDLGATCVVAGTMTLNRVPARGFVSWRGPTRGGGELAGLDGRFRLVNVEPGTVVLKPQPNGLIPTNACNVFPGPWTVEAQRGGETLRDLDLELEMSIIAGRVIDARGVPQGDLEVVVVSREGCWAAQGLTDIEGHFEFAVRAGPHGYSAEAGRAPNSARLEGVLAGTRDLELVLPGSGELRLRVVDSQTRAALTGFVLRLEDERGETRVIDSRTSLTPDAQGWHSLELKPGAWRIFVSDPDGERTTYLPLDGGTVVVEDSSEPQSLELERDRGFELEVQLAQGLEPWPDDVFVLALEPATADQVVLDASGWNIGQAYRGVNVVDSRRLRLDSHGRARITALRAGPHRLVAFPATIAIEPAEVVVTGTETGPLEIRWKPR
jgi:hypothetical protein